MSYEDYEREYRRKLKEIKLRRYERLIEAIEDRMLLTTDPIRFLQYAELLELVEARKKKLEKELESEG